MLSQVHYLIRSKADGRYLTARPHEETTGYLLLFRENFDALSYLNTHAADVANRFTIESIPGTQLSSLLQRWGFIGVAIVTDPLIPSVEFLQHN
ncbi:hypothetical protein [Nostoc sp. TCL26-01]|uniref:hypothetical protein n=1 Tax=Nostoc sp. TCL26-01 TaxID=2576904 RepID=UPI0015BC04E1|nr:hypothetical protein [Nostoc sp. TCL26-01]QLE55743.1 hypothetical protein FD725_09565 [Nostoc sp. TCL26-01]